MGEGDGSGDIDTIARYDCHYCHWNWRVTSAAVERGLQVTDKGLLCMPSRNKKNKMSDLQRLAGQRQWRQLACYMASCFVKEARNSQSLLIYCQYGYRPLAGAEELFHFLLFKKEPHFLHCMYFLLLWESATTALCSVLLCPGCNYDNALLAIYRR